MSETLFGMKQLVSGGIDFQCNDRLCFTQVTAGQEYFLDILKDKMYCSQCGKCLRYARKKAAQRGEPIETAEV